MQLASGITPSIFLEGVTTDIEGNLFMVDVPHGRVLSLDLDSLRFRQLVKWDGNPNGLAVDHDGQLLVADYKEGLVRCDSLERGKEH